MEQEITTKNALSGYKHNVTSQWGEDGIIAEIFNRIGTEEHLCVEFGAWDGKHLSNTWTLWHDHDWSTLLIEGDAKRAEALKKSLESFPKACSYCAYVEPEGTNSLDEIFSRTIKGKTVDLLSIDIDSDDYYVFESLEAAPRVVVIEYNPTVPHHLEVIQQKGEYFGSSARAILNLGHRKGYRLAALTETNLFLVRNDEFERLGIEEPLLEEIFIEDNITYIMTGYDGTPAVTRTPTYHDLERATKKTLRLRDANFQTVTIRKYPLFRLNVNLLLSFGTKILKKIGKKETAQGKRVRAWSAANGDKTLRVNYPELNKKSLVVDVGGFHGSWAKEIFARYGCDILIFEPVSSFAKELADFFAANSSITCHNVGLSNKDSVAELSLLGDKSSTFEKGSKKESIQLVDASAFFKKNGISNIDLMKINIEGAEYELLENLIESKFIEHIKNIQVQFHDFVPNAKERMESIQKTLSRTHRLTYQYPFVWENWQVKK